MHLGRWRGQRDWRCVFAGVGPAAVVRLLAAWSTRGNGARSGGPPRRSPASGRPTVATSLWWVVGSRGPGRQYGLAIPKYTETVEAVSLDVARARGPSRPRHTGSSTATTSSVRGSSRPLAHATPVADRLGFAIPTLARLGAAVVKWGHRVYFATLVDRCGHRRRAHPYDSPSPLGALFKTFASVLRRPRARSTARAVPLIALRCRGDARRGVIAVARRVVRLGPAAAVVAGGLSGGTAGAFHRPRRAIRN